MEAIPVLLVILLAKTHSPQDVPEEYRRMFSASGMSEVRSPRAFATNQKVCYGPLGCLEVNSAWHSIPERPVNVLPVSRAAVDTKFMLYTRGNQNSGIAFTAERLDLISGKFKPAQPIKFIVHGWLQNIRTDTWVKDMASALLQVGDFNVLAVDWAKGASVDYFNSLGTARVVGLEMAYLINTLKGKFRIDARNVHIIGHSLGAHIGGYAGERISNLGRITALDPAGPGFLGMPTFVRLDTSDALFVDAIHTNARKSSLDLRAGLASVGHLDFYVNGGTEQPGCNPIPLVLNSLLQQPTPILDIIFCSHRRSVSLFISSLTKNYVGYECSSYAAFLRGECNSCGSDNTKCAKMGLHAALYPSRTRTNVPLYLTTASVPPYLRTAAQTFIKI